MEYILCFLLTLVLGCSSKEDVGSPKPVTQQAQPPENVQATPGSYKTMAIRKHPDFSKYLVEARHPDHFYKYIEETVSVTIGDPLPKTAHVVSQSVTVPQAAAYSIILRGEPAAEFIILPPEQIIQAPTEDIASSTAYFMVTPLSSGHKKLHYFVKARMSLNDPGIGLPEVHKEIVVEVNATSRWIAFKKMWGRYAVPVLSAIGAAIGAWVVTLLKKWWTKKKRSGKIKKEG